LGRAGRDSTPAGRDSTPAVAGVEIERRFRAGEEEYPDRHGRTSGEMVVPR